MQTVPVLVENGTVRSYDRTSPPTRRDGATTGAELWLRCATDRGLQQLPQPSGSPRLNALAQPLSAPVTPRSDRERSTIPHGQQEPQLAPYLSRLSLLRGLSQRPREPVRDAQCGC